MKTDRMMVYISLKNIFSDWRWINNGIMIDKIFYQNIYQPWVIWLHVHGLVRFLTKYLQILETNEILRFAARLEQRKENRKSKFRDIERLHRCDDVRQPIVYKDSKFGVFDFSYSLLLPPPFFLHSYPRFVFFIEEYKLVADEGLKRRQKKGGERKTLGFRFLRFGTSRNWPPSFAEYRFNDDFDLFLSTPDFNEAFTVIW